VNGSVIINSDIFLKISSLKRKDLRERMPERWILLIFMRS
jgi:hypothetical protein